MSVNNCSRLRTAKQRFGADAVSLQINHTKLSWFKLDCDPTGQVGR